MSRATKCDCCKRCTPDINPKYSKRKRWVWREYNYDSQVGSETKLDICEECWKKIGESIKKEEQS